MKITKSQLKRIIKEELEKVLNEGWLDRMNPFKKEPWPPRAPAKRDEEVDHEWVTKDDPRLKQQSMDTDVDDDQDTDIQDVLQVAQAAAGKQTTGHSQRYPTFGAMEGDLAPLGYDTAMRGEEPALPDNEDYMHGYNRGIKERRS